MDRSQILLVAAGVVLAIMCFGIIARWASRPTSEDPLAPNPNDSPSYHDIEVEFSGKRFRLFNADYMWNLTCTRTGGFELWYDSRLIAGEFHKTALTVYSRGQPLCNGEST